MPQCVVTVVRALLQGFNQNPAMMKAFESFDSNEMNKQLDNLGVSPAEVCLRNMSSGGLEAWARKTRYADTLAWFLLRLLHTAACAVDTAGPARIDQQQGRGLVIHVFHDHRVEGQSDLVAGFPARHTCGAAVLQTDLLH